MLPKSILHKSNENAPLACVMQLVKQNDDTVSANKLEVFRESSRCEFHPEHNSTDAPKLRKG